MKKFTMTPEQIDDYDRALRPMPSLMASTAADPVRDFWTALSRVLGFDPATVANLIRGDDFAEFDAEPLAHAQPEASAPQEPNPAEMPATAPAQEEAPATLVSAGEARGVPHADIEGATAEGWAKIAAIEARRTNPDVEQLAVVIRESALTVESGHELLTRFAPLAGAARALLITAKTITVTAEDQTGQMAMARTMRLQLRDVRLRSEKLRKGLKDESLKRGKAIDGLHHVVEYLIAPEEARLEEMEKFAERAAAERMRLLAQSRFEALMKYGFNPGQMDLGAMPQEDFDRMLEGQKLAAEAAEKRKIEARTEERRKKLSVYGISPTAQIMLSPDLGKLDEEKFLLILDEHRRLHAEEQERRRMRGIERFNELGTWGVKYSGTPALEDLADDVYQKIATDAREAWSAKKNSEEAERKRRDEELRLSKLKSDRMVAISRYGARIEPRLQGGVIIYYADDVIEQQSTVIESVSDGQWEATLLSAKTRFDAQQAKVKAQREKDAAAKKEADDKAAAEKKRADEAQAELNRQKKAKDEEERKRKADEAKAARAPDKQKIVAYIKSMHSITAPTLKTEPGKFALEAIAEQYDLARKFAEQTINEL